MQVSGTFTDILKNEEIKSIEVNATAGVAQAIDKWLRVRKNRTEIVKAVPFGDVGITGIDSITGIVLAEGTMFCNAFGTSNYKIKNF